MGKTNIQWTDYSWSPWMGCRKVSPGCENCYITRTPALRFRNLNHGADRIRTSESYWKQPLAWDRQAAKDGVRRRVFPSLCDPFDGEVSFEWQKDFFDLIVRCPNLDWLLLTKRPGNAVTIGKAWAIDRRYNWTGFPPNVWLGVSCEDQQRADERIPILLSIPAKVRFLSVEPMLEPIDLELFLGWKANHEARALRSEVLKNALARLSDVPGVDWVIFGGESGKNARPCNVDWIRSGVKQCRNADVKAFVKQMGSNAVQEEGCITLDWMPKPQLPLRRLEFKHPKGGDTTEWASDLRVHEFPLT